MNDLIEKIVDLVARSRVRSVSVEAPGIRVKVRRRRSLEVLPPSEAAAARGAPAAQPASRMLPAEPPIIRSRQVGVFHHLEPPVTMGQPVQAGQTVGVIESMKILSDVRAETSGIVTQVLVEDGAPVEFDQPLFVLTARLTGVKEAGQ